jgi:hypothetical protein
MKVPQKESLDTLREERTENQPNFEEVRRMMNADQTLLHGIFSPVESEAYSGYEYDLQAEESFTVRTEREFMKGFSCCGRGFTTLYEFVNHKEYDHEIRENDEDGLVEKNVWTEISLPKPSKVGSVDKEEKSGTSEVGEEKTDDSKSGKTRKKKEYKTGKKKAFKCTEKGCDRGYTSAYGLRYHLEKGHGTDTEKTKPYRCDVGGCGKRYKNSNGLKYHLTHGH